MQAPVQVTVVEYVAEFFRKYKSKAYGKTISMNAKGGADALMGMLKLVLSKGGQDELRIALKCFKDQLTLALNSGPTRQQQLEELFALMSSLIDAAERLRQFSPVKEKISSAVLEEVRWRLFRIVVGDGFSDEPGIRRRALDITFQALHREQQEQQKSLARQQQLAAASGGMLRNVSFGSDSSKDSSPTKGRVKGPLHRKVVSSSLSGPDVSSWEGLWNSMTVMSGKKMLPLLQSVMLDLYLGNHIPGSPAATVASAAAVTPSKSAAQPQKQQQQPQILRQGSNCSQVSMVSATSSMVTAMSTSTPTAAAAVEVTAAPSRSDTAGDFDVTINSSSSELHDHPASAATASSSRVVVQSMQASSSGRNPMQTKQQPIDFVNGAAAASGQQSMAAAAAAASTWPSGSRVSHAEQVAVSRPVATTAAAAALAAAAAASLQAAAGAALPTCKPEAHQPQQQQRAVRVSCTGSNSSGTESSGTELATAASCSSQPGSPEYAAYIARSNSGCLGSPTVAARRGGAAFVAKIRASVGGSNGSSSSSNSIPAGWIPKGWVQFHMIDKNGSGVDTAAAAAARGSSGGECRGTAASTAEDGRVREYDSEQQQGGLDEMPRTTVDSGNAAVDAFDSDDVDWGSCNDGSSTDGMIASPVAPAAASRV